MRLRSSKNSATPFDLSPAGRHGGVLCWECGYGDMLPTHTVTHTGKRTDGAHGAKSFRPHPFCGGNARKALYTNGRRAFYHLVRMRSAVRIRPAAPKRKPPGRVVFCFGKLRCGVEVYPRRGKSSQQLQKFPPKPKGLGGFCYSRPAGKSCGGRRFMLYIKMCLRIQPEESEGLAS